MDIRYNINTIHTKILENFKNTEITEKSSVKFGNYFEISVKESKEVKIIIPYKNIDNKVQIDWFYFSNPLNESSDLIQRKSKADEFAIIIKDILEKNRFSEDYLKN
jgi:hypothetical protein